MKQHTIHFKADEYGLVGTLHLPEASESPAIIGCHGLMANRNSPKQISLAKACNEKGWAYFRFDHRGCGDSQGAFDKVTSLKARCMDLYHAIQTVQDNPSVSRVIGLFGSSFGGTVVLAHAAQRTSMPLITYAAPINSGSIQKSSIRDAQGQSPQKALLKDALSFDISPQLSSIHNILVIHSQDDETVPVKHAQEIYNSAREPKKLFVFNGGDHRMSNVSHQCQFLKLFIEWIQKGLTF